MADDPPLPVPNDLDDLFRICLATGDAGRDAAGLYRDSRILGSVYAAPYAIHAPDSAFVVEDGEGVCGYILGPADTYGFEKTLEAEWWPGLRDRYPRTIGAPDAGRAHGVAHSSSAANAASDLGTLAGPSAHQSAAAAAGQRIWSPPDRSLARCRSVRSGARAAHLAVGARNERAVAFYRRYGFREL
jgi:hypothetical protein